MSINRGTDEEDKAHIHNRILPSHKMEWIWVSSSEVDEPRACFTEWSKSEREKQNTVYWRIYMESRKMALMNLFLGKEWRHRCRERACGHRVGDREWNEWTKCHWHIYTTRRKMDSWWEIAVQHREPGLRCLGGKGWGAGREAHEDGDICIIIADSHCVAEIKKNVVKI